MNRSIAWNIFIGLVTVTFVFLFLRIAEIGQAKELVMVFAAAAILIFYRKYKSGEVVQ